MRRVSKPVLMQARQKLLCSPYFLSVGNHVVSDIPAEIDTQRKEYPDITIKITEHIGKSKHMADILLSLQNNHVVLQKKYGYR